MDITPIKLDTITIDAKKDSLGPGIELLMNEKKLPDKNKSNTDINLDDLNKLEKELNDLSTPKGNLKMMQSSLFSDNIKHISKSPSDAPAIETVKPTVTINEPIKQTTWDGYNKFKDIPVIIQTGINDDKLIVNINLHDKVYILLKPYNKTELKEIIESIKL